VISIASPVPPWDGPIPAVPVAVIVTLPAVPVPTVLALIDAPDMRTDGPVIEMLPALPGRLTGTSKPVVKLPPSMRTACVGPCVPRPVMLTFPPLPDVRVVDAKLLPRMDKAPPLDTLMIPALPVDWTNSPGPPPLKIELAAVNWLFATTTEPPLMSMSPAATAPLVPVVSEVLPVTAIGPDAVSEIDAGASAALVKWLSEH